MSTIRYCGQCGYANETNARFCAQCGHTLPASSPIPTMPIPGGPVLTTFQLVLPYVIGAFGLVMIIAGILLYTEGCIAGLDLFRRCPVASQSLNAPGILADNEDGTESTVSGNRNLTSLLPTATPAPTVTPLPSPTFTATPSPTASLTPMLTPTATFTNTPAPSSTPTLRNDIIIEDFEGSFNVLDINRSPGNNTLNLSIVNNPRASGNESLQMSYQINGATPDQDDYIGFRASLSGISNWQNFSMFCIWIQNDGYSGHLVVQIHPQQGGRWKAAIPLTGFSSGTRCVNFATDFIERGGPLVDIQNYEIYLGNGGATSGTIYIDYMRLIP